MWILLEGSGPRTRWTSALPLDDGDFVVGRARSCSLVLNDPRVSREHLVVNRLGESVSFRDLGSQAGTLLNDERAKGGLLAPGDRLGIGGYVLRFERRLPRAHKVQPPIPASGDGTEDEGTSFEWGPFRAFLDTLTQAASPRHLLERLLVGLVDTLSAERGFVLMGERGSDSLAPVASYHVGDTEAFLAVSGSVYREALESRVPVYVANTVADQRFKDSVSLNHFPQPRTIMCAPLVTGGRAFGVVYLDRPISREALSLSSIRILESVTSLASQLVANQKTRERLLVAVDRVRALNRLVWGDREFVLGEGAAGKQLQGLIEAAAPQFVSVLITGPTGTGKEMVARALHALSPRASGPFIPVNCAALARDVIEAELFGAEKGAFTGAIDRRIGRFELASGGTLFLDEIGEMPVDVQVKLLRVLQERTLTRIGGAVSVPLDFRLVCATNSDLEEAIGAGAFRQDLYYRVNVFKIELKPLRERRDEILPLARHFLARFAEQTCKIPARISPAAERLLLDYAWPGNVRELRNAMERAVVLETSDIIGPEHIPIGSGAGVSQGTGSSAGFWSDVPDDFDGACKFFQGAMIERVLVEHQGNATAAARSLRVARSTLYRHMTKLGLLKGDE